MSFRLIENTAVFPASIIAGDLVVKDLMEPIYIKELKNLNFEEQYCPFPFIKNLRGFFKNDRFKVAVRGDGTFTVYNIKNNVIVKTGYNRELSYEKSGYQPKHELSSGLLETADGYRQGRIIPMPDGKWYVLFNYSNAMLCDIPLNSYYLQYCRSNLNPKEPVFLINGNHVTSKSSLFVGGIECQKVVPDALEPLIIEGGYL